MNSQLPPFFGMESILSESEPESFHPLVWMECQPGFFVSPFYEMK